MMEINTTPLIDVMLVLLIMFIITIPVMTHAVKLDMPRPNPNVVEPPGPTRSDRARNRFRRHDSLEWDAGNSFGTLEKLLQYRGGQRAAARAACPGEQAQPSTTTLPKALALAQRQGIKKIGFVGMEQFAE